MSFNSQMQKLAELNTNLTANEARENILSLFDADTFVELDAFVENQEQISGVICGYGYIEGALCYAYIQDSSVDGGSINIKNANKIKKIYDLAYKNGCPVIGLFDSNGAKVTSGNEMLAAYGEILQSVNNLSGVVPMISVVLGTCAGLSSLIATSADFIIMNEKAELFLTAPFTAKAHGKGKDDSANAKNSLAGGLASIVCEDTKASITKAKDVISLLPSNNLTSLPLFEATSSKDINTLDTLASDLDATDVKTIIENIFDDDSVIELKETFGVGIYTALATLQGTVVGIVATNKIKGELNADACIKAAKLVKTCDAFSIPVITFVDAKGFELTACPKLVLNAASLASAYAEATTQKINIITGEAIGSAYIALAGTNANADVTYAWPTGVISPLAPVTTVEFLFADKFDGTTDVNATRQTLVDEYIDSNASAFIAAKQGHINGVIAPNQTRGILISTLDMLCGKRISKLPKKHNTI